MNPSLKELIERYKRGDGDKGAILEWLKANANRQAGGETAPSPVPVPRPADATPKIAAPAAVSAEQLTARVQAELLELLSRHLKVELPDLDPDAPLEEFGFDSISLNEFTRVLETRWKLDITAADLIEYNSIGRLAVYFAAEYGAAFRAIYPEMASADAAPAESRLLAPAAAGAAPNPSPRTQDGAKADPAPLAASRRAEGDRAADPIAIIGMSGTFPGSPDLESYWRHLADGDDLISEIPAERRARWGGITDLESEPASSRPHSAGFMGDVDKFDCHFFNISPREAELMDPQQRIFMETVWHTVEDAGYKASALSGSRVGLFVAVVADDYMMLGVRQVRSIEAYFSTGCNRCVLPNRVSHFFNWRGPSETVDTACSSSLLAVHRAVRAIRSGECETAVAGGVNVLLSPHTFVAFQKAGMLAADGRCKPFDERADGYVRGEGVGAVMLKPLSRALADGDSIRAVIRGSATNHTGKTSSLTVPGSAGQAECLIEAMEEAGFDPATVGYIEAHGTGTKVGDPVEFGALQQAFAELGRRTGRGLPSGRHCGIGSVKSNIGHLEGSAGISSMIKVVLALERRRLPRLLNFKRLNPSISMGEGPFYIVERTQDWNAIRDESGRELPRRAGINSFGFGGVNVHVALEEFVGPAAVRAEAGADEPHVIVLSAKTPGRLNAVAAQMRDFLLKEPRAALSDIAFTLQERREEFAERLAFVARSREEAAAKVGKFLGNAAADGIFVGRTRKKAAASSHTSNGSNGLSMWDGAARDWTQGIGVDWAQLRGGSRGTRIRIPQYPFERKAYWLPVELMVAPVEQAAEANPVDLRVRGGAQDESGVFYRELEGDEFYLIDHRIGGSTILPGVAHMELAWSAASQFLGAGRRFLLQNVVWVRPILFEGATVRLRIALKPKGERWRFEISGIDPGSSEWSIRSQGNVALEEGAPPLIYADAENLARIQEKSVRTLQNAEIYELFSSVKFEYGPGFKSIDEIWATPGDVVARVKLPRHLAGDFASFSLHPSLLDGALQCVTGIGIASRQDPGTVSLPFSVGKVRLYQPLPNEFQVHLRSKIDRAVPSAVQKFDIDLIDGKGQILLSIEDFTTRQTKLVGPISVPPGAVLERPRETSAVPVAPLPSVPGGDSLLYGGFAWCDTPVPKAFDNAASGLLLLGGSVDLARGLAGATGTEVVRVSAGERFIQVDPLHWEMDRTNADHYVMLLNALVGAGKLPQSVLHAWGMEALPADDDSGTPGSCLDAGLYSVVHLGHAWIKVRPKSPLSIVYGHLGADPRHVMVDGFLRSLAQEMTYVRGVTAQVEAPADILDLYSASGAQAASGLLAEQVCQLRRRGGRWERRRHFEASLGASQGLLKQGGVYVVTGGMGGLGRILSSYLSGTYRAKLLLCGKSPLDTGKAEFLGRLRVDGSGAEYLDGDIRDPADVQRWVKRAVELWGRIDGVFHCAGVVQDAAFARKTVAQFKSVLEPKIAGALNLEKATRGLSLDFVAFFSSVASVAGSRGQTDYASANRFLDAYAERAAAAPNEGGQARRIVSINWPLWAEGGMRMPEMLLEKMRQVSGMAPLPAAPGMRALEAALGAKSSQVSVLYGDSDKMRAFLHLEPIPSAPAAPAARPEPAFSGESAFGDALMDILSDVLKVPRNELDPVTDLGEYGVDSIMAMQLLNRMEERFGRHLDPSAISQFPTIESLARYLAESAPSSPAPAPEPAKQAEVPPVAATDNALSANAPIAVIGLACRLPGSPSVDAFWENLKRGANLITEIPTDRWQIGDHFDADKAAPWKSYSKWGAFLDGIELFDPGRFGITETDARVMDPQHRILLELSDELFSNAGYRRDEIAGQRGGVFIGAGENGCTKASVSDAANEDLAHMIVNSSPNMMAARISDFYDLHGPAWVMSTACSSSLVAIHSACQSLRLGESDWAVAGGAQLLPDHVAHVAFSKAGVLADDGVARVFDRNSKGFVLGEGFGLVMLKRLDAAMRDGDQIEAVILGSAVNNDGHTMGLTTPNMKAQIDVLERAWAAAGIGGETLGYLEAHGTGTLLGDPIEIKAASEVLRKRTQETQFCAVGSVKSNLGHGLHAAAMASVIKVVMALKHGLIPPTLHCAEPHPRFRFEQSPFFPALELQAFPGRHSPRRAGVSSFGFGGTNCHMVFEQFDPVARNYRKRRTALGMVPFERRRYSLSRDTGAQVPIPHPREEQRNGGIPDFATRRNGTPAPEESAIAPVGQLNGIQGSADPRDRNEATNGTGHTSARPSGTLDPAPELVRAIQRFLVERAATAAGVSATNLSTEKNFMELGIDSVALVQMTQTLEQEVGVEIYPTLFFEYQNIRDLSLYFAREEAQSFAAFLKLPPPGAPVFRDPGVPAADPSPHEPSETTNGDRSHDSPVAPAFTSSRPANSGGTGAPGACRDIAIIGMAGRFAESENVDQFWEHLDSGKNLIGEIPRDHFDYLPYFDPHPQAPGKLYCKWGSFLTGVDRFDAGFFGISPREAQLMDPQMRMILETMHSTAEDAACAPRIRGSRTGVYIGACFYDYSQELARAGIPIEPFGGTGNAASMLANRPSYFWNLNGPSLTVDTACSSSLVALHLACQALRRGECEMAFAAGVNLILSSPHYIYFCCIGALSPTGRCHTFDQRADGYVPGEAVGCVLLKPLDRAIADGDPIRAVIRGSAVNHGGRSNSVTAPNPQLEANVLTSAWEDAGIDPNTLGYIEAHGTGTKLGDPVEIQGIKLAFKGLTARKAFCAVGSAKAHIGHAEGAAGIAGVIKTVLSMEHGRIPSMPQFAELNPLIRLKDSPLFINSKPVPWQARTGEPLRAGVSSFGFGGTYAHVVLESAPQNGESGRAGAAEAGAPELFVYSARNRERLVALLRDWVSWVEKLPEGRVRIADMAHTLRVGRESMECRVAFVARDLGELRASLARAAAEKENAPDVKMRGEHGNALSSVGSSQEDLRYFQDLLRSRQLEKLGLLWVGGASIAWHALYGKTGQRCISIPGYPFSRERYWHSAQVPGDAAGPAPVAAPVAIPVTAPIQAGNGDVRAFLNAAIASLLSVKPSEIDPSSDLQAMGFDSIMGMQLIQQVQEHFGVRLYANEAQMHPTVGGLVDYLASEAKPAGPAVAAPDAPGAAAPTFLLSAPRSGSTLLRVMLAGHSKIFCPPELHVLPFDTLQSRADTLSGPAKFLGEGLTRAVMELRGCNAEGAAGIIDEWRRKEWTVSDVYRALEEMANGRIVIDKSPSYGEDLETLKKSQVLFPRARYVFLVRHPIAVMESYVRNRFDKLLKQKGDDPWKTAEDVWLRVNRNLEAFRATLPSGSSLLLRYEDIMSAPEEQARRICDFLQIPFERSILEPYKGERMVDGLHAMSLSIGDPNFKNHRAIEPELADAWRKRLTTLPDLSPETGQIARQLGYDLPTASSRRARADLGAPQALFLRSCGENLQWNLEHRFRAESDQPLDAQRVDGALNRAVRRHPLLRSVFGLEGGEAGLSRSVLDQVEAFRADWMDLSGRGDADQEAEVSRWFEGARRAIDPRTWPLFRFAVADLGAGHYEWLLSYHHLIGDGISSAQLLDEIVGDIGGEDFPKGSAEAAEAGYNEYVSTVNALVKSDADADCAYWERHCRVAPGSELQVDFAGDGSTYSTECELLFAGSGLGIPEAPRFEAASVALYRALFTRLGGEDPVVAHRLHGRPPGHIGARSAFGCYAIDVPLRFQVLQDESTKSSIERFRRMFDSVPSGGVTYPPLVLGGRLPSAERLASVRLNYQPRSLSMRGGSLSLQLASVRPFEPGERRRPYVLDFIVRAGMDDWTLVVRYSSALHREDSIRSIVTEWVRGLAGA